MKAWEIGALLAGAAALVYTLKRQLNPIGEGIGEAAGGIYVWIHGLNNITASEICAYAYCWQLVRQGMIPPGSYAAPPAEHSQGYLLFCEAVEDHLENTGWWRFTGGSMTEKISRGQGRGVLEIIREVWGWEIETPDWLR